MQHEHSNKICLSCCTAFEANSSGCGYAALEWSRGLDGLGIAKNSGSACPEAFYARDLGIVGDYESCMRAALGILYGC